MIVVAAWLTGATPGVRIGADHPVARDADPAAPSVDLYALFAHRTMLTDNPARHSRAVIGIAAPVAKRASPIIRPGRTFLCTLAPDPSRSFADRLARSSHLRTTLHDRARPTSNRSVGDADPTGSSAYRTPQASDRTTMHRTVCMRPTTNPRRPLTPREVHLSPLHQANAHLHRKTSNSRVTNVRRHVTPSPTSVWDT